MDSAIQKKALWISCKQGVNTHESSHTMEKEALNLEQLSKERLARQLKRKDRDLNAKGREIESLLRQLHALQKENALLKERLQEMERPEDCYRMDWTWVRKIVFVLEQAGRPMRSPEVIEELAKREEHLRNHWNQAQYFSAFLNKALKEERIKREKRRGERGFYYSIAERVL